MPLPALKLPAVASMYGGGAKPYHHNFNILVRQMTFSSASATATSSAASSSTTTSSSSSSIRPNSSLAWTREWRKTSCAPFPYHRAAHDRNNNKAYYKKIGFRSYCFSSEGRKGGGESRVSLVTEMGPPDRDDRWYDGELSPAAKNHLNEQPPLQQQQQRQHQPQSAKLLTLPTILTIGRVAAVPLFVSTFYVDSWWGPTATTVIFIAAAITDWLDGYLARKMKLGTAFGAFLDPVADKLMVAATLVLLCTRPLEGPMFGQVPWLLTGPAIAIIGREITMSAVREWAAQQSSKLSEAVAVNNLGKWKTASQMTALTILLATRDSSLAGAEALKASGVLLLYISAWLAVWSLFVYIRKIWRVLLM